MPSNTYTYVSQAHGSAYCVTTNTGKTLSSDQKFLMECVSSDHIPLCINMLPDSKTLVENCYDSVERKITNWKGAKSHNIEQHVSN